MRTLRGRATLGFTVVTAGLSTLLVLSVWAAASGYLLLGRERTTLAQTRANAMQVQRSVATTGLTPEQLLSQLTRETGSTSLLLFDGEWRTSSLSVGRDDLPAALREMVAGGTSARQRFAVRGHPVLAVGIPLAEPGSAYFEVFPLDELDHTYRLLGVVLAGAWLAVVPASLLLGRWLTRPTLRPLEHVAEAARAIASGDLGARIDPGEDPHLIGIAESFNATAKALEERVRRDARFAADVSHELRSPLTSMVGALSLVEDHRGDLPDEGREALALLHEELTRFERLVADLLEISRADAGSADVALEEVRLSDLVRQALSRRVAGGPLRGRLTIHPSAAEAVVLVEKQRLDRILGNLLDNADKHGGGVREVLVEATAAEACITVDDAGPGVPADERMRIFERFARGGRSSRNATEGAGLGLSLAARHARAMGGSVSVSDNPAGGARFVVRLPVRDAVCDD